VTRARTPEAKAPSGDPNAILTSIGLVPYDWRIDADTLVWGANAAEVLQVGEPGDIATGRGYAAYLDPKNTSTLRRRDADRRMRSAPASRTD
jgi:hypothetical protein